MAVSYIEFFLSFLPFYYEAKIVVCFWLANLSVLFNAKVLMIKGAQIIFNTYLAPFLIQYEDQIDERIRQVKTSAYSTIVQMGANAFVAMQKVVMQGIMEVCFLHFLNALLTNI